MTAALTLPSEARMSRAVRIDPVRRTFVLSGEIDMENAPELRRAVEQADWLEGQAVTFDVGDLRFIDASGIHALLSALGRGCSIVLLSPTPAVRRLLELLELDRRPEIDIR